MIDPFVLLTPILVLAVMALVRFVGCFVKPTPAAPNLTSATPADDQSILLQWEGDSYFKGYNIKRAATHGGPYKKVGTASQGATSFPDTGLSNTTQYFYVVSGQIDTSFPGLPWDPNESGDSNELSAFPTVTVTFNNPGNADDPLTGVYNNELDFGAPGAQPWYWKAAGNNTAIYLGPPGAAGTVTGTFGFANTTPLGRRLVRLRVIADPSLSGNITIGDQANPTIRQPVMAGSAPTFIETMWQNISPTVTITSDIGWDIAIDVIVYEGPP
jgi:hypothetical protein